MSHSDVASSDRYRADIDGLRAIAVLLVVLFHFQIFSATKSGFIGVDVFFVISGFLITSIIRRQLDDGSFSLASFYVARVRRLAPALFVVLLAVLVVGSLTLFPDDFIELCRQAIFSQFYIVNFYYWRSVNYFGLGADNVFLLHMWSLAVEEQFYLFYPLLLLYVHKYHRRFFWPAIGFCLVASFALNVAFVATKPEATFYLFPTRAWELLIGGLVPLAISRWARPRIVDELLGWIGIGLIAAGVLAYSEEIKWPGVFALLPVIGAACLILSGEGNRTLVSRALSVSPIAYIGKISYPLYLVHWPIKLFAARFASGESHFSAKLAMLGLSLVLAAALYHLVETPVRKRRVFANNKRLLWGYCAGVATTIFAVVVVRATDGLPGRFPKDVIDLAGYVNDKSPPLTECEHVDTGASNDIGRCRLGVPGAKPKWLVYGDSHAWAAHEALDRWLALKGEAGVFVFRPSCPPVMGIHLFRDRGGCFAFNRLVADFLVKQADIGNVVMVSTWLQAAEARLSTSPDRLMSVADSLRLFGESFAKTLAFINGAGKRTYVWEPVPGAKGNVPLALARAALEGKTPQIEFTRDQYFATFEFFFAALRRNQGRFAVSFSPSQALCQTGKCEVTIGGKPAYFDNSHITRSTADFWVRMMQQSEEKAFVQGTVAGPR